MKLQIITILKNKDNVSNPLFIKAMGGFTIYPVFLNKILSMAGIGICIEKELLQWKVNESVEKIICRKKCEENLFF